MCKNSIFFIHEFAKNLPTVGGGHPTPSPRSVAPLPRFSPPPVEKPGYASGISHSSLPYFCSSCRVNPAIPGRLVFKFSADTDFVYL